MRASEYDTEIIAMKELMHVLPQDIEKESFRIIGEELQAMGVVLPEDQEPVTKRVIHTTADFTFVDSLEYTEGAVEKARELIRRGATIVTDTNMALTGISKPSLAKCGAKAVCFMADPDVAAEAKERGVTRASVSMERAQALEGPVIYAIGNAPTALIELHDIMERGGRKPDFIIGVPVGFVNVEYSKELFRNSGVPYIINFGRKGGSTIAAAICNAILYTMVKRD